MLPALVDADDRGVDRRAPVQLAARVHEGLRLLEDPRPHALLGPPVTRRWGPHRTGYHFGIPRSTVGRVLARYRMPLLHHLDQATGLPVRKPKPVRYEKQTPGELLHVDIKTLGMIPDGGGWRMLGRQAGNRNNKKRGLGYAFLHHAVDDCTRLAYSENSSATNARRPWRRSGSAPARSSPSTASP